MKDYLEACKAFLACARTPSRIDTWHASCYPLRVREPSQAETLSRIAQAHARGVYTALPGLIVSYDPILCEVSVQPAVFGDDESDPAAPLTCPLRVYRDAGFMVGTGPLPGSHCTLVYHGLDPSAFWAAPSSAARAELTQGAGIHPEAWPAMYGPGGPAVGALWLGTLDGASCGVKVTAATVQLGTGTATHPNVLGDTLYAYLLTLQAWGTSLGFAPCPPPPTGMLSTKVLGS